MVGSFATIGDAQAALSIARSEIARGIYVPPTELRAQRAERDMLERIAETTVAQWSDDWLARLESMDRTPATLGSYRSTLKAHILPALGSKRLIDVTPADIDAMLDKLVMMPGAWTNAARVTRSMFLAAVAAGAGGLAVSPMRTAIASTRKRAKRPLARTEVATAEQVAELTTAMPEHLAIAVPLAAWCALRQGEVLGLQRGDFAHLEEASMATVHVSRQWNQKAAPPTYTPPKAGSDRIIAIPPVLVPLLLDHLDTYTGADDDAPLMPRRGRSKLPISQTTLDNAWRAARAEILPGFRFHSLRHTGLTAFAQAGATIAEIQARGGHSSVEVALRYQHATLARDRTLAAKLGI
ncbi:tyrosine-type recombinase/integrase [Demequina salsinemoris]|uniref:tyrosine-type recombinase/integrase n=1 Tax=Demequina salsinemoris TaxID=577470 RepID=UPI001364BD0A|nr:site-specific integrase [Demequina salsinemoris]